MADDKGDLEPIFTTVAYAWMADEPTTFLLLRAGRFRDLSLRFEWGGIDGELHRRRQALARAIS